MNLLDLPDLVLEEIIYQCIQGDNWERNCWQITALMECNKFLKSFIETSSRLMAKLTLRIDMDEYMNQHHFEAILSACNSSTRRYRNLDFFLFDQPTFEKFQGKLTRFLNKQGPTLRNVNLHLYVPSKASLFKALRYLQNMINVEKLWIVIHIENEEEEIEEIDVSELMVDMQFPNFEKLKSVSYVNFDNGDGISSTIVDILKNCRSIVELDFDFFDPIEYDKMNTLLASCQRTLKKFIFRSGQPETFFKNIKNVALDLKVLHFRFTEMKMLKAVELLLDFLKTQNNLKEFVFNSVVNLDFINKMKSALDTMRALRVLKIDITTFDSERFDEYYWKLWHIAKLETLELKAQPALNPKIVEKILQLPSNNLQSLMIQGLDLHGNIFDRITKNYRSLNSLTLQKYQPCTNYESNDIFLILKFLKQLNKLEFAFPTNSRLNSSLFYTGDNLILPHIEDVKFHFNKFISTAILIKLTESIGNVSQLQIRPCISNHSNFDFNITVDILTKELPNMARLYIYEYFTLNMKNIQLFQSVKLNLMKFNKKPHQFKLNELTVDDLILNATK